MLPLCLGTFQQRDGIVLDKIVDKAILSGIRMFDTAPSYKTEKLLGEALHKSMIANHLTREELTLCDKIDGWQMQDGNVKKHVKASLEKLGVDYFDFYLVHWPFSDYLVDTWLQLYKLKNEGIIKKIGLCNVRCHHIINLTESTGIKPDCIQIERHPLWNSNKEVCYCRQNGIKIMDYSPLCRMDERIVSSPELNELSKKYNKTISQIVLRWHLDTDCIPVFMTKKTRRIEEHTNIFDFTFQKDEIDMINGLDCHLKISLESWGCPGF